MRFWALSRNSIAAHLTRRYRIRLIRWMMIGTLTRAAPARNVHGLRNCDSIGANLGVGGRYGSPRVSLPPISRGGSGNPDNALGGGRFVRALARGARR